MWGWEPKTVTKHKYKDGVLIKTVSRQESEWDAESYELLAALSDTEADTHTCGQPLSESASIDANPDNRDGHTAYQAESGGLCFACDALRKKQAEFDDNSARLFRVEKIDR